MRMQGHIIADVTHVCVCFRMVMLHILNLKGILWDKIIDADVKITLGMQQRVSVKVHHFRLVSRISSILGPDSS